MPHTQIAKTIMGLQSHFTPALTIPEQRESPPELSEAKRLLQDEMQDLDQARSKLLGAHEVLSAHGFSCAELIRTAIADVSAEIIDLEDKINAPEGEREG